MQVIGLGQRAFGQDEAWALASGRSTATLQGKTAFRRHAPPLNDVDARFAHARSCAAAPRDLSWRCARRCKSAYSHCSVDD
jgi:hypothetical protein